MRKATEEEKAKLNEMLAEMRLELYRVEQRLGYLSAFLKELHVRTRGMNFEARNPLGATSI